MKLPDRVSILTVNLILALLLALHCACSSKGSGFLTDNFISRLTYGTTSCVFTLGEEIIPNVPSYTGNASQWSVEPELPQGLTLNSETGIITGTPEEEQNATEYTITASNGTVYATTVISVTINLAPPKALTYETTACTYSLNEVIKPNMPSVVGTVIAWSINPALPDGLMLNASTGIISGTPIVIQSVNEYTITAANAYGSTDTKISIRVSNDPPQALSYDPLQCFYTLNETITPNEPTVTGTVTEWSVNPDLPEGFELDEKTGVISGTPKKEQEADKYIITAANQFGSTTVEISITINDRAPSLLSYSTATCVYTIDEPITANVPTITGTARSWSVDPALPAGLTMNTSTGIISGTPETVQPEAVEYTITARNSGGETSTVITIEINDEAPENLRYTVNPAKYYVNIPVAENVPLLDGTAVSWSVDPSLPAGLTMNTSTGVISGAAQEKQSALSYTITAENTGGSASTEITIAIFVPGETWKNRNVPGAAGKSSWTDIASSEDGNGLAALVNYAYIYTSQDGGSTWEERLAAGARDWSAITSSADGTKLAAAEGIGYIYTSTSRGESWHKRTGTGSGYWNGIASSANGNSLVAVGRGFGVFTSTNGGTTWIERTIINSREWNDVACSSDGTKIAVACRDDYIYTSADGGASWTKCTGAGDKNWIGIASSADGSSLAAVINSGNNGDSVYTSINSGATWTKQTSIESKHWWGIASSSDGLNLAAINSCEYVYTSINGGETWTAQINSGNRTWRGIASSSSGLKLAAVEASGYLYTSDDSGLTWTERSTAGTREWRGIASSSDMTRLAAVIWGGYIYTSDDSGATWNEHSELGKKDWDCITSSTSGMKLAAAVQGGYIYTSDDGGDSWIEQTNADIRNWDSIASSSDGMKLAAGVRSGYLYTSQDGGETWVEHTGPGQFDWDCIASSTDGMKLAAGAGYIYTSIDGGENWTRQTGSGSRLWHTIASSADGTKLAATVYENYDGDCIYTSSDSGLTWTRQTSSSGKCWKGITMSSDGKRLAAVDGGTSIAIPGYIYTSADCGVTWVQQTSAGLRLWMCITSTSDGTRFAATAQEHDIFFSE